MNYIPVECKGPVVPVAVDLLGANQFLPLCTYLDCSRKTLISDTLLHSASFFSTTPPWIFVSTAQFFHLKRRQEKSAKQNVLYEVPPENNDISESYWSNWTKFGLNNQNKISKVLEVQCKLCKTQRLAAIWWFWKGLFLICFLTKFKHILKNNDFLEALKPIRNCKFRCRQL